LGTDAGYSGAPYLFVSIAAHRGSNYTKFLEAIDRIQASLHFLQAHKHFKSADKHISLLVRPLARVTLPLFLYLSQKKLSAAALADCEAEFRSELAAHSRPVDPARLPVPWPDSVGTLLLSVLLCVSFFPASRF
jgi:hypothetical protein